MNQSENRFYREKPQHTPKTNTKMPTLKLEITKAGTWRMYGFNNSDMPLIVRAINSYEADQAELTKLRSEREELLEALKEGEDIISGLEAEADNAGIDLYEVRKWWRDIAGPAIAKTEEVQS